MDVNSQLQCGKGSGDSQESQTRSRPRAGAINTGVREWGRSLSSWGGFGGTSAEHRMDAEADSSLTAY